MTQPRGTTRKKRAPGVPAALDRRGGKWRLVIDRSGRGGTVEQVTLADAELAKLGERLSQAGVTRLIRVAPAGECVAKLEAAPDASGEELAGALALIGEGALPEDVPFHRRAVGVIGDSASGWAIATAWMGRPESGAAGMKVAAQGVEEVWVAEPAAMLVFARPDTGAMLSWDRESGSVLAAKLAGEKPVVRCIRLDGSDAQAWERGLRAAAAFAGVSTVRDVNQGVETAGPLSTEGWQGVSASMVSGEFGPALGAIRLASDEATARLAAMRRASDDGRESAVIRAARWIGSPKRAGSVIAAAVALSLLAPVGFAYVRLKVVDAKLASIGQAKDDREKLAKEAALYRQLEKSRWPMTKLLADVMNAMPVGVTVDNLTIEREGDQAVMIKGKADNNEILTAFQRNLSLTGLMGQVSVNTVEAGGSGVSFSLQSKVAQPRAASRLNEDFGKRPLADRSGVHTAPSVATHDEPAHDPMAEDEHEPGPSLAGGETRRENGGGGGSGGDRGRRTPGNGNGNGGGNGRSGRGETASSGETNKATKPVTVPAPLTDAQIAALDGSVVTTEWALRRAAAQRATTSPEDKARLEEEVRKLDAKRKGGGS